MEKTEVDDLKNGMEKERCKINYFQAVLRIRPPGSGSGFINQRYGSGSFYH
jgi:hypothetical protein